MQDGNNTESSCRSFLCCFHPAFSDTMPSISILFGLFLSGLMRVHCISKNNFSATNPCLVASYLENLKDMIPISCHKTGVGGDWIEGLFQMAFTLTYVINMLFGKVNLNYSPMWELTHSHLKEFCSRRHYSNFAKSAIFWFK